METPPDTPPLHSPLPGPPPSLPIARSLGYPGVCVLPRGVAWSGHPAPATPQLRVGLHWPGIRQSPNTALGAHCCDH